MTRTVTGSPRYYVLTDSETGTALVVSLWETREQMEAVGAGQASGIDDDGVSETGVSSMSLATYEVALRG